MKLPTIKKYVYVKSSLKSKIQEENSNQHANGVKYFCDHCNIQFAYLIFQYLSASHDDNSS